MQPKVTTYATEGMLPGKYFAIKIPASAMAVRINKPGMDSKMVALVPKILETKLIKQTINKTYKVSLMLIMLPPSWVLRRI